MVLTRSKTRISAIALKTKFAILPKSVGKFKYVNSFVQNLLLRKNFKMKYFLKGFPIVCQQFWWIWRFDIDKCKLFEWGVFQATNYQLFVHSILWWTSLFFFYTNLWRVFVWFIWIVQSKAIESNTFKLINTALTLKNIFQDNQHTLITPLSMFDSFYLSKELKPIELDSVQYLVRLVDL